MNFKDYLEEYNKSLQPVLDELFDKEKQKVSQIAPIALKMIDDYRDFLEGGKKLRGCEIFLGYQIFGGKDEKVGLLASLVIEILHAMFLVHDDIMDQDDLRRGNPTIHKKYSQKFGEHYGESIAMDIGDEGTFLAFKVLNSLNLEGEKIVKAAKLLSELCMEVGLGQALDMTFEAESRFKEEDVLLVHRYKTAEYTIPGPLSIGAILAGCSEENLKAIKDFGIPIGVAFQIRDDELGMFSSEEELGKPVDSDIRQGKVTLLIVKAFEKASEENKEFLQASYGKGDLTKEEIERVRQIIRDTGSLDYSQKLSRKLVVEGKEFVKSITSDVEYQELLNELADFVIERES